MSSFFVVLLGNNSFFFFSFMEDLTKNWSNLSLNEREGVGFTLRNQFRSAEFIIAAKFLTKHVLNMDAVARTFRQLWQSIDGFKIRSLEDHIVLFVFSNPADVNKIIQSEPWCFNKHLVVMKKYDNDGPIRDILFTQATFWAQVHDNPIRFMTKTIAESICDTSGLL